jgi:hypothetical protein
MLSRFRVLLATPNPDALDQSEKRLAFSGKAGYTAAPYNANRRRAKWVHSSP